MDVWLQVDLAAPGRAGTMLAGSALIQDVVVTLSPGRVLST
jgi:hypothetical protein